MRLLYCKENADNAFDEPVSLEAAKRQCNIDGDFEDESLKAYIAGARLAIEAEIDMSLSKRSFECLFEVDEGETKREIRLPRSPLADIQSVSVGGDIDNLTQIAPSEIGAIRGGLLSWIRGEFTSGFVKINFIAGYDKIPSDLNIAMLQTIAHYFSNRSAVVAGAGATSATELPRGVDSILSKYKKINF